MFKKINYLKDLKNLTKSINIKLDSSGYQIQYYLYKNKGYSKPDRVLDNKREWKYYINLSGRYHSADKEMSLYNRYIDQEMKLTIENINMYPELKEELLTYGEMFTNLVKKYPSQESLIKSILLPVDIDYALDAENATILNYNTKLLDKKEYSLIPKLQDYIHGFLVRWYIEEYVYTDDLYLTTVIGMLYTNLYVEIESIRLSNIFTYEAHDYYMGLFFASHLDTSEDINILPENVRMWLYKNLRFIERHTGKNSTLDLIVDKMFTAAGLGIGEINLIKEDVTMNLADLSIKEETAYSLGKKVFKTNPLNDFYIANRNKEYDLSQITKKQMMLVENTKLDYDIIIEDETTSVNKAKYLAEKTKILEFDDKIVLRSRTIPEMHTIVDNWFYYAFNNRFNFSAEIKDTNTNLIYNVTAKQAALMLLKVMLSSIDRVDTKLSYYKTSAVLRHDKNVRSSVNRLFIDRDTSDKLTNAIFDIVPEERTSFTTMEEMKEYLLEVNELNNIIWYTVSNCGNAVLASTIKSLQDRLYLDKDVNVMLYGSVESTVDELLLNDGIEFKIEGNYNYVNMIKLLITTFTGLSFNTTNEDTEDMEKLLKLIKKVISYSVQILYTPVSSSSIESPYSTDSILQMSRPMITPTGASFIPLEEVYGEFFSKDYLFNDLYTAKDEPADVDVQYCRSGFGLNYRLEKDFGVDLPEVSMSINFECLDLYIPGIDIEVKRKGDGIIDISTVMDMDIVVLIDRDDIALVHIADKHVPVKEEATFNMSLDYTSVDMNRLVETEDVFIMDGAGVTLVPSLTLNDYIIDDRKLDIGDLNIFATKTTETQLTTTHTDELVGYMDRAMELPETNIRETRSISTIIKVDNTDEN